MLQLMSPIILHYNEESYYSHLVDAETHIFHTDLQVLG